MHGLAAMQTAQQAEVIAVNTLAAARDSDAVQSLGLTKKSEYKAAARRAQTAKA